MVRMDRLLDAWRSDPRVDATVELCAMLIRAALKAGPQKLLPDDFVIGFANEARTRHPSNIDVSIAITDLYLSTGLINHALAVLDTAARNAPTDNRVKERLEKLGRRRPTQEFSNRTPDPETLDAPTTPLDPPTEPAGRGAPPPLPTPNPRRRPTTVGLMAPGAPGPLPAPPVDRRTKMGLPAAPKLDSPPVSKVDSSKTLRDDDTTHSNPVSPAARIVGVNVPQPSGAPPPVPSPKPEEPPAHPRRQRTFLFGADINAPPAAPAAPRPSAPPLLAAPLDADDRADDEGPITKVQDLADDAPPTREVRVPETIPQAKITHAKPSPDLPPPPAEDDGPPTRTQVDEPPTGRFDIDPDPTLGGSSVKAVAPITAPVKTHANPASQWASSKPRGGPNRTLLSGTAPGPSPVSEQTTEGPSAAVAAAAEARIDAKALPPPPPLGKASSDDEKDEGPPTRVDTSQSPARAGPYAPPLQPNHTPSSGLRPGLGLRASSPSTPDADEPKNEPQKRRAAVRRPGGRGVGMLESTPDELQTKVGDHPEPGMTTVVRPPPEPPGKLGAITVNQARPKSATLRPPPPPRVVEDEPDSEAPTHARPIHELAKEAREGKARPKPDPTADPDSPTTRAKAPLATMGRRDPAKPASEPKPALESEQSVTDFGSPSDDVSTSVSAVSALGAAVNAVADPVGPVREGARKGRTTGPTVAGQPVLLSQPAQPVDSAGKVPKIPPPPPSDPDSEASTGVRFPAPPHLSAARPAAMAAAPKTGVRLPPVPEELDASTTDLSASVTTPWHKNLPVPGLHGADNGVVKAGPTAGYQPPVAPSFGAPPPRAAPTFENPRSFVDEPSVIEIEDDDDDESMVTGLREPPPAPPRPNRFGAGSASVSGSFPHASPAGAGFVAEPTGGPVLRGGTLSMSVSSSQPAYTGLGPLEDDDSGPRTHVLSPSEALAASQVDPRPPSSQASLSMSGAGMASSGGYTSHPMNAHPLNILQRGGGNTAMPPVVLPSAQPPPPSFPAPTFGLGPGGSFNELNGGLAAPPPSIPAMPGPSFGAPPSFGPPPSAPPASMSGPPMPMFGAPPAMPAPAMPMPGPSEASAIDLAFDPMKYAPTSDAEPRPPLETQNLPGLPRQDSAAAFDPSYQVRGAEGAPPTTGKRPFKLYAALILAVLAVASLVAYATYLLLSDRRGKGDVVAQELPSQVEELILAGAPSDLSKVDGELTPFNAHPTPASHMARVKQRALVAVEVSGSTNELDTAIEAARNGGVPGADLEFAKLTSAVVSHNLTAATAVLETNADSRDKDPWYAFASGLVYEAQGSDKASSYFAKAVELEPRFVPARIRLARNLILENRTSEAKSEIEKLPAELPSRSALEGLSWASTELKASPRKGNAPKLAITSADLPRSLHLVFAAVSVLNTAAPKSSTDAQPLLEKAINDADAPCVAHFFGEIAFANRDDALAIAASRRGLALAPDDVPSVELLARVGLRSGRFEAVEQTLAKTTSAVAGRALAIVAYERGQGDILRRIAAVLREADDPGFAIRTRVAILKGDKPVDAATLDKAREADRIAGDLVAADGFLDAGDLARAKPLIEAWPDRATEPTRALRYARLLRAQGKNVEAEKVLGVALAVPATQRERILAEAEIFNARDHALSLIDDRLGEAGPFLEAYVLARKGDETKAQAKLSSVNVPDADAPLYVRIAAALAYAELDDHDRGEPLVRALLAAFPNNPDVKRAARKLKLD